jgi:FkbM family methyltransferase
MIPTEMRQTLKSVAIRLSDRLLRDYIRYSPLPIGKLQAWRLYDDRFSWRSIPRTATTRFGFRIPVRLPDHIQKVIWLTGGWEPVITQFVRSTLAAGDTFIDVGANIGYYSLLASRIVGAAGRVYAIEGSRSIFALLQDNLALNRTSNVQAVNAIVADRDGEQEFWLHANLGQSTAVAALGAAKGMRLEGRGRCAALTELVPEQQLRNARIIKVDVEGSELAVLQPLFATLSEFSVRTMWAIELSPQLCPGGQADVTHVFEAFCAAGYTAYTMANVYSPHMYLSRPRSAQLAHLTRAPADQADVLFLRR